MNVTELDAILRALSPAIKQAVTVAMTQSAVARDEALRAFEVRMTEVVRGIELLPGPPGPQGAEGVGGNPGPGVELAVVEAMVQQCVADAISKLPPARDGKDGEPGPAGKDGVAPTIEDLMPAIAAEIGRQIASTFETQGKDFDAEFTRALASALEREAEHVRT